MNWDRMEGRWRRLMGKAQDAWGWLTGDLGRRAAGIKEQLVGGSQELSSAACERAERAMEGVSARSAPLRPSPPLPMMQGLALVGLGAGLMYYLDPDRGRRRRALVRDQFAHAWNEFQYAIGVLSRDLSNRARGLVAVVKAPFAGDSASDQVIVERVRSTMGRVVSHPSSIEVTSHEGRVTLYGPILAHEVDNLLTAVSSVRGVREVINRLEVHKEPGDVPGLQGGRGRPGIRPEWQQYNWAPAARLLAGAAGAGLLAAGARQRGMIGMALGLVGTGMLARAATNIPLQNLFGLSEARRIGTGQGRRALEVRKTININSPIDDVFAAWADYRNFPHFMSRVREVRDLGNGRSHWVVEGPTGAPIQWNAVITQYVPNEVIAWRSEPGAVVQHAGMVHFRPNPDGSTQVSVQLSYNPAGGALGHGIAWLFGADPKHQLDEDLMRMKTFLETGRPPHDASQPAPTADQTVPQAGP
ncbi:MAG: SRPBCC family protein [Isosphaeraceae bacterium]|nr:SRPBCC family protein [Isosphaeraceae bacterium]